MKKHSTSRVLPLLGISLVIILTACSLVACGGTTGGGSTTKLEGAPADILKQMLDEAAKTFPPDKPIPASFDNEVTADTSQNTIGLSPADFNQYVSSATVSTAAISTFPHEISLIQAKDATSATEIKKLIAADGGYNSQKWICVWPEESCVIDSGNYVLLIASRADITEAVIATFTAAAGNTGEKVVFFTSEAGAGGIAPGGGGMALNIDGGETPQAPQPQ